MNISDWIILVGAVNGIIAVVIAVIYALDFYKDKDIDIKLIDFPIMDIDFGNDCCKGDNLEKHTYQDSDGAKMFWWECKVCGKKSDSEVEIENDMSCR